MEAEDYFQGGYYRSGTPQYTPEKQGKAGGGDHFIVEDLLDFPNEEEDAGEELGDGAFDAGAENLTDSSTVTPVDSCSNSFSGPEPHFSGDLVCRNLADVNLSGDLCEPFDELAELEWLSNFVEESFSSEDLEKLQIISGIKPSSSSSSETRDDVSVAAAGCTTQSPLFRREAPVPGKARSKRSRAAPCNWSSRLLLLSQTPISTSSSESQVLVPSFSTKKPLKPAKKKDPSEGPAMAPSDGRRCLHCATDKTPQWRTGPMGPKTLCNACGVRYKSGRLVPEYRPAASPTFVLSKHSNSHRKVIELRRQKELQDQQFLHPGGAAVYDGVGGAGDDFLIHHHIGPDFRQLI